MKPLPPLPVLLVLAGCGDPPAPAQPVAVAPPAELCAQVREGLETLKREGALDHDDKGVATIDAAAWFAMGPKRGDELARALGWHAACAATQPAAQQHVVVRSPEGQVLMRQTVPTVVDPSAAMGDPGS